MYCLNKSNLLIYESPSEISPKTLRERVIIAIFLINRFAQPIFLIIAVRIRYEIVVWLFLFSFG